MIEEARRGRAYELIHWSRLNVLPTSPFNTFPSSLSYFPTTLVAAPLIVHPPRELLIEKDLHDDKPTVDDPSVRGGKVPDRTVPIPSPLSSIPSPPAAAQVQVQPRPLKLMARPLGIPSQVPNPQVPIPQVPTPQISVVPPSWAKIATQSLPVSPPAAAGSTVCSLILKERAAAGKPPKSPFPMTPMKQPSKDSSSSSSDLEGGSSRSYESADGSRSLPSVKDKIQHNGQVRKQCRKVGTTRTDEDRARVQREVEAMSGPEVCPMEAGMIHATNSNESCMPHTSSFDMYEDFF